MFKIANLKIDLTRTCVKHIVKCTCMMLIIDTVFLEIVSCLKFPGSDKVESFKFRFECEIMLFLDISINTRRIEVKITTLFMVLNRCSLNLVKGSI